MKLLRVDMKNENTVATDLPKGWLTIGGSGLIAKIMNDEDFNHRNTLKYFED